MGNTRRLSLERDRGDINADTNQRWSLLALFEVRHSSNGAGQCCQVSQIYYNFNSWHISSTYVTFARLQIPTHKTPSTFSFIGGCSARLLTNSYSSAHVRTPMSRQCLGKMACRSSSPSQAVCPNSCGERGYIQRRSESRNYPSRGKAISAPCTVNVRLL